MHHAGTEDDQWRKGRGKCLITAVAVAGEVDPCLKAAVEFKEMGRRTGKIETEKDDLMGLCQFTCPVYPDEALSSGSASVPDGKPVGLIALLIGHVPEQVTQMQDDRTEQFFCEADTPAGHDLP